MARGLVINPNGTVRSMLFDTLKSIQQEVGGPIEVVPLPYNVLTIYCNEEGLYEDEPCPNPIAMMLASDMGLPQLIVGTVVVLGPERNGDDTDISPVAERLIINFSQNG